MFFSLSLSADLIEYLGCRMLALQNISGTPPVIPADAFKIPPFISSHSAFLKGRAKNSRHERIAAI
jgi:hypothetical protein